MKNKLVLIHFVFCFLNFGFVQGANYYWVGGTGNWSDYANHWATTSGGNVFQTQVPTSFDNVYFDVNSFTANGQIVTNDTTIAYCLDMDWTGATNNPVFEAANSSINLQIFGSLVLNPVVNFSFNGQLTFTSFNLGKIIQTFSNVLQCPIEFNGAGGEWTLLDSLTTTKNITLTYGTLRTNNNNLRCNSFYSTNSNACALYLGTSTVSLTDDYICNWQVSGSLVIDADSSIIRLLDGGNFNSNGHTYNIVEWDINFNAFGNNRVESNNYIISKVICLNPSQILVFSANQNIQIDSVIDNGSLRIEFQGINFYNYLWVNHDAQIFHETDTIMKMIVNGNLVFDAGGHYIHDLTVGGDLSANQSSTPQTFDSCRVYGNANIHTGNNHLGIFTMTPGKTLTLAGDSTQYIDSLCATGNPGFPIQILSSDFGHAANVVIQDALCTNYLYIHAVHATSPNLLYVGANSNDVANNSGWIFTNCLPTGMEEDNAASLSIFPNPATSELIIQNAELRIQKVEIYSAVGQNVFSQKPATNSQQLVVNISELNPGIYFAKLKGEHQEYIAKFVKQ